MDAEANEVVEFNINANAVEDGGSSKTRYETDKEKRKADDDFERSKL